MRLAEHEQRKEREIEAVKRARERERAKGCVYGFLFLLIVSIEI